MTRQLLNSLHLDFFRTLQEGATSATLYVVGGFVRDLAMGKVASTPDIDLVVENGAEDLASYAAAACEGELRRFPAFLTFKIENPRRYPFLKEFDIATARSEIYPCPGALPKVKPTTIENDLRRRDFTVNAMAMRVEDLEGLEEEALPAKIYDPYGGYADLKKRIIRVLHDKSFIDDPTRLFRACRYAARIDGVFEPVTRDLAAEALRSGAINTISWFRILTEMRKGLSEQDPLKVFAGFNETGLLENLPFVPPNAAKKLAEALVGMLQAKPANEDPHVMMLSVISSFCDSEGREALFRAANLSRDARNNILKALSVRSGCEHDGG